MYMKNNIKGMFVNLLIKYVIILLNNIFFLLVVFRDNFSVIIYKDHLVNLIRHLRVYVSESISSGKYQSCTLIILAKCRKSI